MKQLLIFVLTFLPSIATSMPQDSIPAPFNAPFSLVFDVIGVVDTGVPGTGCPNGFLDSIYVNPQSTSQYTQYTMSGDSIFWDNGFSPGPQWGDEMLLILDSVRGEIAELTMSTGYAVNDGLSYTIWNKSLSLKNLHYDSSSIYFDDSLLSEHYNGASYSYSENDAGTGNTLASCRLVSVSLVALSGIFRPIRLSYPALVEQTSSPLSNISVRFIEGSLFCSFNSSDYTRTLELYTPLGIQVGNYEIAPGQTSAAIPPLAAGLYFIRMDGVVVKVAVP
jgi:hypothetical protein